MADKFKKIDKEYVLSDSSVNCYGFRLLTSGYQLAEYSKNPIGFYMHNRPAGVVLRWENLRVDGDTVYGKPVINLSNVRGEQTADEIEAGFLNAASMGEFVVLEYSIDPEMMLAGQTGPTIIKWYNRECSMVDIPGNSNALCKLFDNDGNEMKLADLMAPGGVPDDTLNSKTISMKKITLSIPALFYAITGLTAAATPEEVEGKLSDLIGKANKADELEIDNLSLTKERDKLKKQIGDITLNANKQEVTALLDKALEDKKMTVEVHDQLAKDYESNPTGLKALVAGMGIYTSVTSQIKNKTLSAEDTKKYEGKDWDTLDQEGLLKSLKAEHPDLYKAAWEKEHNQPYPEPKA